MKRLFLLCLSAFALLTACKKEQIAPANQKDAFVKYFGHVRDQKGSDVKQTSDGGYLLLGSSNSFSITTDDDFYLVKTDTLGNEEWSKTFGDGAGGYDEEGIAIVVLANDEGYLVAGNRTKMELISGQSTRGETLIVLYKLDLTGTIVWEKVLRQESTPKTDIVSDIKQTPDGGFILIGSTTKVATTKPEYTLYSAYDEQDILVLRLDMDANIIWTTVRGFVGEDKGASVEFFNGDYIIVGSTNLRIGGNPSAPVFLKQILVARLKGTNGNEQTYHNFGGANMFVDAMYSCHDTINGIITILSHVEDLPSVIDPKEGDLLVLQVTEGGSEVSRTYLGKTSGGIAGVDKNLFGGAISLVPAQQQGDDPSFILTATHEVGNGGTECVMVKLLPSLVPDWSGNGRFFGRPGVNGSWLPGNHASRVLPIEETVAGTSRKELVGYVFTGTFNLGTNNMVGLVKTNKEGTLTPVD